MRTSIRNFSLDFYFLGAVVLLQSATFADLNETSPTSTTITTTTMFQTINQDLEIKTTSTKSSVMVTTLNQNLIQTQMQTPSSSSSQSPHIATQLAPTATIGTTKRTATTATNVGSNNMSSSTISTSGDVIFSRKIWTKNNDTNYFKKFKHSSSQNYKNNNNHHHEHHWGPFFEEPALLNASQGILQLHTHLSTEAVLNCRVGMLRDKIVMWVRRTTEKVSLLTVGNVTYSADPRIKIKFQYPNNWRLLINPVTKEDAGLYMCQVSTHPPRVFVTNLTVLDRPMRVTDEKGREVHDRYYKSGSTIDLTCQVNKHFIEIQNSNLKVNNNNLVRPGDEHKNKLNKDELTGIEILKNIIWRKDNDVIRNEAISNKSYNDEWYNARIIIPQATFLDNGLYKCSIAKFYETIVQVQILTGELPAAVQHNKAEKFLERITFSFILTSFFMSTKILLQNYYHQRLILF